MEGRYVNIRGINYYVAVAGYGQPVLLLHGFTGSHEIWGNLVQNCSHRFLFLIPDLLGHGCTDSPEDASRYLTEETVQDLAHLLDVFGIDKCFCLGYSMGGRIALSFALSHPNRVSRLILESASPGLPTKNERDSRIERDASLANRIEMVGTVKFADEWAKIPLFSSQQNLDADVLQKQQQIRNSHREIGLANSLRGIGTGSQPSNWNQLQNIQMHVLLITGMLDKKFRDIAIAMMEHLPYGRHEQVAGAGHTVHLEQPIQFASMVSAFLSESNGKIHL